MGLPQDVIECIMVMLRDDLRALKACSLTCRAMFVSTRHLIHRTLFLTRGNNISVLTQNERTLYPKGGPHIQLRFLSHMGEAGFLRYTRRVHISMLHMFTPDALLPHLHHFQSLDRVHALTVDHYDTVSWASHFKTCFVHFYPTLTSLTLRRSFGHYRLVLQFALQFPNLEDLCLEWLANEQIPPGVAVPAAIDKFPPLCGHLRLAGFDNTTQWPMHFAQELRKGMNFRSVELESAFFGDNAQQILIGCAGTIEDLIIVPSETSTHSVPPHSSLARQ